MPRQSNIEYKEKKVKGLLDRVTAVLSGTQSGVFTRIASRYKRIDKLISYLQTEREKLNERVKENIVELFDAEDEVLTRVVESVSLTATLSKRTPAYTKEVETFDQEGFLTELYEMLPELEEQIRTLQQKYTILNSIDVDEKSPALRVKFNESEDDTMDKISEYADLVSQSIMNNLQDFDRKFAALKNKM
jgi:hypothetical protein